MLKHAFSLVELSIVLVILGLLSGGILTGQNLIRAAELRSVTTEFQKYQTAVMTFRDKYFALPGDMPNATDFWGQVASGASCKTTASSDSKTCNGDGDGQIEAWISTTSGHSSEHYRFWQQLANAGLVEGFFTGVPGSNGDLHSVINMNVPSSKISSAGWAVHQGFTAASHAEYFDGSYGTRLMLGAQATGATNQTVVSPILKPEEIWNIDTKIDDGKPGHGKIMSLKKTSTLTPDCASSDDAELATYNLASSEIACSLIGQPGW